MPSARRVSTCASPSPRRRMSWPGRPWPCAAASGGPRPSRAATLGPRGRTPGTTRLHQGGPDQRVPSDQGGSSPAANPPVPAGRAGARLARLRGRVPHRDLYISGTVRPKLGEHRAWLPHCPRSVGEALVPARRGPQQRHRVTGAQRADDDVVRARCSPRPAARTSVRRSPGSAAAASPSGRRRIAVLRVRPARATIRAPFTGEASVYSRVRYSSISSSLVSPAAVSRSSAARPRGPAGRCVMAGQGRTPTGRRSRCRHRSPTPPAAEKRTA